MPISSINFKPAKSSSESHNNREVKLDYNYPELEKDNESWSKESIADRRAKIETHCKEVSGRKLQKNATPIREAVVNLDKEHSMDDLLNVAERLRVEKQIDCFQIHIHRDEGKSKDDLNYHAHMIFDWQDKEKGTMLRLNKVDMSQIQTIVAQELGLQRGELKENSNRERLEPIEYKRKQEQLKVLELQNEIKILEQKKNRADQEHNRAKEEHDDVKAEHQRAIEQYDSVMERVESVMEQVEADGTKYWTMATTLAFGGALKGQEPGTQIINDAIELQRNLITKIEQEIKLFKRG